METSRTVLPGVPVIVSFSPEYPDGSTVAWTSLSNVPDSRAIAKVDPTTGEAIDVFVPAEEGLAPPPNVALLSGAYNLVDDQNRLIVGYSSRFEAYGDAVEGDPDSEIELISTFQLPDSALCRAEDTLVGQVTLYDGTLAFATEYGMVGLLPGDSLAITWQAPYETGESLSAVRLGGGGSGSTPSLMGTGEQDDQLVVITDGQEVMHVVLLWRGEIPGDWQQIAADKDPRIACEVPVRFGDPDATNTETEQSVLVRDWSTVLVNNRLENSEELAELNEQIQKGSAALSGGDPNLAPYGIERIDWDPETRTCSTVWANPDLSIPNGVPTMSADSGLVYGIGLRDGIWGLTGVDFGTGEDALWVEGPGETDTCAEEQLAQFPEATSAQFPEATSAQFPEATSALFATYFEQFPTSCDNSFYAATEVGPDSTIFQGVFGALEIYRPG